MLQVQHIVEASVWDLGPANDFLPIRQSLAVTEGRPWQEVIGVFELLLCRERLLDEVCVEAAQAKHKDAEDASNYDANQTGPVLLKHFSKPLRSVCNTEAFVLRQVVRMEHEVCDAHDGEKCDCKRQVSDEDVE